MPGPSYDQSTSYTIQSVPAAGGPSIASLSMPGPERPMHQLQRPIGAGSRGTRYSRKTSCPIRRRSCSRKTPVQPGGGDVAEKLPVHSGGGALAEKLPVHSGGGDVSEKLPVHSAAGKLLAISQVPSTAILGGGSGKYWRATTVLSQNGSVCH